MAGMISTPPAEQQLGQLAASCRPVTGHPRPRSPSLNSYIACGVTRLLAYSLAAQLNAGPVRRRGTEGGPLLPRILANWITGVSWCAGAAPTPGLSRWSARSAARTNDLDSLPRDTGGRERLTSPLLESSKQGNRRSASSAGSPDAAHSSCSSALSAHGGGQLEADLDLAEGGDRLARWLLSADSHGAQPARLGWHLAVPAKERAICS